ncbi:hypothetical protein H2198_008616 [Neophaeococcomyces mojaviensis]|uniref:Uncharacterized protein n=1 Tax=Neophaeococcomyces mojaviensis TaxID=3383035 RepID=A0ACC2ZWY7_9EURO|nr:hypothetical protein H2198_008616 [Knufia sp. JES_112]
MEHFLKMLKITNTPAVPASEDENATDADEPPDDRVPELNNTFKKETLYSKNTPAPVMTRRESLLTRAIQGGTAASPASPDMPVIPRGMSTTSSHSFASTAELTSDAESPTRSASPSPPPPLNRLQLTGVKPAETGKVLIASIAQDDKPTILDTSEATIEKTLGRKRCIMFACKDASLDKPKEIRVKPDVVEAPKAEPAPRKCRISFACPSRPSTESKVAIVHKEVPRRQSSPAPVSRQPATEVSPSRRATESSSASTIAEKPVQPDSTIPTTPHSFHEFASSHEDTEEWVEKANELTKPKLTIDDCLKKENAIRKLGKEAEEEAEAEEREQEELENELEDEDNGEDDFAPSDEDDVSDGGNESDDEEGFADSDSESELGSEFWAPSTNTAATSAENITHFSSRQKSRSRASSTSSAQSFSPSAPRGRFPPRTKGSKPIKMRPGTPELPDSTDFVCGTFDEDRTLEDAYISCREQRRRQKHVPIPQDIDPSFPTSDLEEEIEEEEGTAESSDHQWIQKQFEDFDDDVRGRRPSAIRLPSVQSPAPVIAGPRPVRPVMVLRGTNRSPPPKHHISKSPAPRRLFDQPPKRLRSPPPTGRLRSPRGSPTGLKNAPFSITINHLAQRPNADKTASLPHTPNPFFRNWQNGRQPVSRIISVEVAPGIEELRPDLHVRGPVDIVIGLEKKRQKRKEKYWRQHCRKAAKERAVKKAIPGRGVERMKELGLECAERTRGYGLGQQAQLVLSL